MTTGLGWTLSYRSLYFVHPSLCLQECGKGLFPAALLLNKLLQFRFTDSWRTIENIEKGRRQTSRFYHGKQLFFFPPPVLATE